MWAIFKDRKNPSFHIILETGKKLKMKEKVSILLLVLFLGCKQNAQTQSALENPSQELIESITKQEVSAFVKEPYTNISGVIYIDGMSYQFHFGNMLNGSTADDQTIYEIGSITKTYTGLLLSQAVQDKKVSLDVDVRKYLKGNYPYLEFDSRKAITLRHLITHTAGLPPSINCDEINQTTEQKKSCFENFTEDNFFKSLKNVRLIDRSGNKFNYSNAGVQLVGYILENVYQLTFQKLAKRYVFSRSHEQNTLFKINYNDNLNISLGKNSKGIPMPLINGFYNYAGGLKSSTNSMLNYIKMYLESDDLVVQQAMSRLSGNNEYGRAYAWNTYNFDKKLKMLYHNGGTFGHSSWIALYPNQKAGIFLVTNILTEDSQGELNQLSNKIMEKLLK